MTHGARTVSRRPGVGAVLAAGACFLSACPKASGSGTVSLDASAYSVEEGAGKVTVTVTRTGGTLGAATFELTTFGGTATAGSDYTPVTVSVSFADQDGANKLVDVPILQDVLVEGSETFQVKLVPRSGEATLGTPSEATVTIGDDDAATSAGSLAFASAASTVVESAGQIVLTVTRTAGSAGAVSATLTTADGSAIAGQDYGAFSTAVSFADGETTARTVVVPILEDSAAEGTETFTVVLSLPTGGATLGSVATTTISILDNDGAHGFALNDTGLTTCATASATGLACNSAAAGTDAFPHQDAENGRDVTFRADGDGRAGFAFVKLDAAGAPLSDQSAPYATTPWACLGDQVTGLTWEVRTTDGGLRDRRWRYSWYSSLGLPAAKGKGRPNGGLCVDAASCDTEKYVAAVNTARLCGGADWRLPTRSELLSLVDYGAASTPLVDAAFFPDGLADRWWSSTSDWFGNAWSVDFATGSSAATRSGTALPVRLVRGGF